MTTGLRRWVVAGWLGAWLVGGVAAAADAVDAPGREIPAPFAPFEYLIGSWKGSGVPVANRIRGWNETHAWAWKFEKGNPVGLSVTATGDKVLLKARLVFDPASKTYTLAGAGADGKPVSFVGAVEKGGKALTLERQGTTPDGSRQRLTLTPNANFVRYSLYVAEQEPGAPQYKRVIEVGLTKEGESFAAGGSAADLPKCIVTGGSATMTVSYQGKSFPLCCSGCKDEFNDNPEKYIKKLALRAVAGAGKTPAKPASSRNKDDGAFEGVEIDAHRAPAPAPAPAAKKSSSPSAAPSRTATVTASEPAGKSADAPAKAASLVRLGQNLERSGKSAAALGYYQQVLKLYPDTPSARTASERVKALGGR